VEELSTSNGKVFLSHTSKHVTEIQEIAQFLEENDIQTWYAPRDIAAGEPYHKEILYAIEHTMEVMLVFITEDIDKSIFVPKEVERAVSYAKKVIPVMKKKIDLPKSVELLLGDAHWIELDEVGLDGLLNKVLEAYEETKNIAAHRDNLLPSPVRSNVLSAGIAYAVSNERKALVEKTFIEGPGFKGAESILANENIAVLYHAMHTGKYSAALNLLLKQGTTDLYELTSDITPKELFKLPILNNSGYLLHADASISNWEISESAWDKWLQQIVEKNSYICIVTAHKPKDDVLKKYLTELEAPDCTIEMLKSHYKWKYQETIHQHTVKELFEHLPSGLSPRETVHLVPDVRQLINGDLTLEHLEGSIESVSKKRVKDWFDQNQNTQEIAMLVAISVFEGETFDVIIEKRNMVEVLLDVVPEEKASYHFHIAEYLQKFHAFERQTTITTDYGHDHQLGVFLHFTKDRQYIWRYLWRHLSASKKEVFNKFLLNNILDKKTKESVVSIYTTLMEDDFSFIRKTVLHQLIKSRKTNERLLAIQILERYMQQTENYTRIWNLVKSWAGSNNYSLKWSVMMLLKGSIGKIYFEQSIELTQRLVTDDPKMFHIAQDTLWKLGNNVKNCPEWEATFYDSCVSWLAIAEKNLDLKFVLRFKEQFIVRHPEFFYRSVQKYYRKLWLPFFDQLYRSKTKHVLLQQLIKECSTNDIYFNLLKKFISFFKEHATPVAKKRMMVYLQQRQWMEILGE
jgi:hypothetical protein